MRRLIFFGDSICVGQGVSIHRGWVPRLAALIEEVRSDLVIVNASVNGNTTRLALERMPYEVQSGGLAMMILQFGMNDCNYWDTDGGVPRVAPRSFEANLHEIIDRAVAFGASDILLNTNHPTTRHHCFPVADLSYQDSNRAYNEIIRRVAQDRSDVVRLNDIETHFIRRVRTGGADLARLLLDDGLHLSEDGHDVYLDATWPKVAEILDRIAQASNG